MKLNSCSRSLFQFGLRDRLISCPDLIFKNGYESSGWKIEGYNFHVSNHNFRYILIGPFEKFTKVTTILPLTGRQYSDKVSENCVAFWKSVGIYTDAEAKAIEKFNEVLKDETFPPGNSILFTHSPLGALTMSFSKDGSLPEVGNAVIENKLLTEAVLESIIGKHGVSPEAKKSLAARLSELFCKEAGDEKIEAEKVAPVAC